MTGRFVIPNITQTSRKILLAAAIVAYWPYALILANYEFLAPCKMGGEGLLPGLFVGGPVIFGATVLVWLMRESVEVTRVLRWVLIGALAVAAVVVVPQVINTTIQGNHPCGAEFNPFNAFVEKWDRWIPVANLALIGLAALVGLGPFVRKVDRSR